MVVAHRLDAAIKKYDRAFVDYLRVYNSKPERLRAVGLRLVHIDHAFKGWVALARKAIAAHVVHVEATTFSKYVSAFQRWLHNQLVENQLFFDCFSAANGTEGPPPTLADCTSLNPALFRLGIRYATVLNTFQRLHPELADLVPNVASTPRPSWMVL